MFISTFLFYIYFFYLFESKNASNNSKKIIISFNYETKLEEKFQLRNLDSDNSNQKNLIIGLIKGYTWQIIKPFFISLISAKIQNYELVVFVDKLSEETLDKIKLCGAIIKDIPEKNLGFQDLIKYRWKLFSDFLKENKDKYNLVFATDVKDVIFQKDIFKYYNSTKPFISFNLEDTTLRNPLNKNWVRNFCKTNQEYFKIADEQVISEGTIISTIDKFIEFADTLWQEISNLSNINDQGAINYLIYYKKLLNDSIIISDNTGPIMALGVTGTNKILLDSNNNVLNNKGKIAAVVHKYDRKPDIVRKINKKYNDDVLNTYLNIDKTKKENKNNDEYKEKIEKNKRIKIIRKIILFSFIIISMLCLTYIKGKKSGLFKKSKKERKDRSKTKKIKKRYKNKYIDKYNLSSSENRMF
jgi:hypothetical protein